MAYVSNNFNLIDIASIKNETKLFKYTALDDTLDAISDPGYFTFNPDDSTDVGNTAQVGDFILVRAADYNSIMYITGLNPTTTRIGTNLTNGNQAVTFTFNTAANATNTVSLVLNNNVTITGVDVIPTGVGHANDTVELKVGIVDISNPIDISSAAAFDIVSATGISISEADCNAGQTLNVVATDGGGTNIPACRVYVYGFLR